MRCDMVIGLSHRCRSPGASDPRYTEASSGAISRSSCLANEATRLDLLRARLEYDTRLGGMVGSGSDVRQDRREWGLLLARSISPLRRRQAELFALFQYLSVHLLSLHAGIGLCSAYSAIDVSACGLVSTCPVIESQ